MSDLMTELDANLRAPGFERRNTYRTLVSLAAGLQGQIVTIFMRRECSSTGKVVFVDSFMNFNLENVAFSEDETGYVYFSKFFVPNRMIRAVVIPSGLGVYDLIRSVLPGGRRKKRSGNSGRGRGRGRGRTFRDKRMMENQQEALRNVRIYKESRK